jgi:hypothetical protein
MTSACVQIDSTNHAVWKRAASAVKTAALVRYGHNDIARIRRRPDSPMPGKIKERLEPVYE